MNPLPPDLEAEKNQLLKQIEETFQGVSREGGVSWGETMVIDGYGAPVERMAARLSDKDTCWKDVLDDPKWNPETGIGGWSFLDAIGFRYYLPAGMVAAIERGADIEFHLQPPDERNDSLRDYVLLQRSLLNDAEKNCIRRFVLFMRCVAVANRDPWEAEQWKIAFERYWATA